MPLFTLAKQSSIQPVDEHLLISGIVRPSVPLVVFDDQFDVYTRGLEGLSLPKFSIGGVGN
jgi:hypothetical protein